MIDELPNELELCGYVPLKLHNPEEDVEYVLERLLESLDDNYGGEDYTESTPEMKEITLNYLKQIFELYTPWRHEIVTKEIINVKEWVTKHRPDWLVKL